MNVKKIITQFIKFSIVGYINFIANIFGVGRNGKHRYNNKDHSILT